MAHPAPLTLTRTPHTSPSHPHLLTSCPPPAPPCSASYYIGEKYTLRYTGGMVPDVFQIIVKEKVGGLGGGGLGACPALLLRRGPAARRCCAAPPEQ